MMALSGDLQLSFEEKLTNLGLTQLVQAVCLQQRSRDLLAAALRYRIGSR